MIEEISHTHTVDGRGIPTLDELAELFANLSRDFPRANMRYVQLCPNGDDPYFSVIIEYQEREE